MRTHQHALMIAAASAMLSMYNGQPERIAPNQEPIPKSSFAKRKKKQRKAKR